MALSMNRIIDFELSKTEGKFTVKAGVDPDLDLKKQTLASLGGLMSETAKVELARLPECVQECSMLYLPHLGYLLGVRAWRPDLTASQKELPNMKFMFQNNDYIHYKSKGCEGKMLIGCQFHFTVKDRQENTRVIRCVELDVMIGDTYPEIVAHETRIMMRLTALVLQHLHTLAALLDKCAHLDWYLSHYHHQLYSIPSPEIQTIFCF
ncbi:MutS protein-like 5 [Papilio xuthus]|uniref:MutS protein-like 5 n=1 Tax=Papilio xuthus TaxID=66420 RepID=A0A194Q5Q9_PAPXU|nr:MutS protein-like 5 [Papilio xuthus]